MIAAAMGWIGTIGTITAYVMLTRGQLRSESIRYAMINFFGGLLGATASISYGAWPSVVSNVIWSGVAVQSIVMTLKARDWRWAVDRLPYVVEVEPAETDEVPVDDAPTAQAA
jgi:hypothetical protein